MARSPNLESVSTRLQRIAQLAWRPVKGFWTRGCATGSPDCVAKPWPEEPYAVVPHVRVCGGPGWVTCPAYPAVLCHSPSRSHDRRAVSTRVSPPPTQFPSTSRPRSTAAETPGRPGKTVDDERSYPGLARWQHSSTRHSESLSCRLYGIGS